MEDVNTGITLLFKINKNFKMATTEHLTPNASPLWGRGDGLSVSTLVPPSVVVCQMHLPQPELVNYLESA